MSPDEIAAIGRTCRGQYGGRRMNAETTSVCDECGASFSYDPRYHECAHKQKPVAAELLAESWVDECMRKQREGVVR